MLLGIDATVGTWDKENARKHMVRGKMDGHGTVGAWQVAQKQLQEVTNYTRREVLDKRMSAATAGGIVKKAQGKVKVAYRPGYREAAARAGVDVTRGNVASTICNSRVLPRRLTERVGSNTGRIITLALSDEVARSVSGVSARDRR